MIALKIVRWTEVFYYGDVDQEGGNIVSYTRGRTFRSWQVIYEARKGKIGFITLPHTA